MNGTTWNCAATLTDNNRKFTLYMLPVAMAFIVALSFLLVRRKKLWQSWFSGRPGLLYPMNFIDGFHRRWLVAICFVISSTSILDIFLGGRILDPLPRDDPDMMLRIGWLTVFVEILNVVIVCLLYFPVFACVTFREHIVANVAGFIYILPLMCWDLFVLFPCELKLWSFLGARAVAVTVLRELPVIVSYLVYLISCSHDLYRNAQRYRKDSKIIQVDSITSEVKSSCDIYVKALLLRNKQIKPLPLRPTTAVGRLKKLGVDLVNHFKYERLPGFQYSSRLICTLAVSSLVVLKLAFLAGVFINVAVVDGLRRLAVYAWAGDETLVKLAESVIGVCNAMFGLANGLSGFLQMAYMLHMMVTYRRRMLRMYRGDNSWHCAFTKSPSAILVGGMRYSGYQIAFFIYGWLFTTIGLSIILMPLGLLKIDMIRAVVWSFFTEHAIRYGPTILISVAIYYGQVLLCKYVFLQDNGGVLSLNNRRLYHVMSFFLFIFNVIVGAVVGLMRVLLSAILGTIRLGRLDHVLIMRGFERLDSGHSAYLSMMTIDEQHNHPVMRSFIDILVQSQHQRHLFGTRSEADKRRKRVINRWLKAVTLVRNPILVVNRAMQQCRLKLPGQPLNERTPDALLNFQMVESAPVVFPSSFHEI